MINGLILMGIGMGIVFIFLYVLIIASKVMSSILNKFFPQKEEIVVKKTASNNSDVEIAIAIAVAHQA